jgi:hypothetical protein
MKQFVASVVLIVAFGKPAWAAESSSPDSERIVVSAAGQGARFLAELEHELRASSFAVVEVAEIGSETQAMISALTAAKAARGVRISDQEVAVFSLTNSGHSLRLFAERLADLSDRLARRRQWISLVERLRVTPEDDPNGDGSGDVDTDAGPDGVDADQFDRPAVHSAPRPVSQPRDKAPNRTANAELAPPERPACLGAAAALGYARGNGELLSHLQLTGQKTLSPPFSFYVAGLWPLVAGERIRNDIRSRAWTFTIGGGVVIDLGPSSWLVQPFVGMGVGMQFLVVYVDYQAGGQSDVEKTLSGVLEAQVGTRIKLRPDIAMLFQLSGARAIGSASPTSTLADTWLVRSSLGLQIDF